MEVVIKCLMLAQQRGAFKIEESHAVFEALNALGFVSKKTENSDNAEVKNERV